MSISRFNDLDDVQRWADRVPIVTRQFVQFAAAAFSSGWTSYGPTAYFAPAGYWITSDGMVELTGLLTNAAAPAVGTNIVKVPQMSLPAPLTPGQGVGANRFLVYGNTGTGVAIVDTDVSGNLILRTSGVSFMSLCGIRFAI